MLLLLLLLYRVAIEKMHMHVMIVQIHSSTSLEEGSGLAQELPATLSKSSHPPHNYLKRLLPVHVMTGRVYQRRAKKKLAGQTEKSG